MAEPTSKTTVTTGEFKFNALSAQVGAMTMHDLQGMPQIGSSAFTISLTADMHDNGALPFLTLQGLFDLSHKLTKDKVKDIKIEFWTDERKMDAICVYSFRGWVSSFFTISSPDTNHLLSTSIQPALEPNHFVKISMSN